MSFTMEEIIDQLGVRYDPEELVELLELNSREIAERFDDAILELWDNLQEELNDAN
tara:strand:- start:686 stop:853 length:168 start_codon:yes stop_codon:yes gene_type:complete